MNEKNEMKILTIAQKMSNTGSIHDLASDQFAREIKFRGTAKFAVVLAAYYGGADLSRAQDAQRIPL